MRRMIPILVSGVLAASLVTPSMASEDSRTATKSYTIQRGRVHVEHSDDEFSWWLGTSPVSFKVRSGERQLGLSLTDDSGNPVLGHVEIKDRTVEFCSETAKPIPVRAGQKVFVSAIFGSCDDTASTVTEGTIKATFSK